MRTASAVCMGTEAVRDCILLDSWNPEPTDSEMLYYLITGVRCYSLDWVAKRLTTDIKDEEFACRSPGVAFHSVSDCRFLFSSNVSLLYMSEILLNSSMPSMSLGRLVLSILNSLLSSL